MAIAEVISAFSTGTPQGTDMTPATDPTDTSLSPTGTTKKFIRSDEFNFYMHAQGYPILPAVRCATTANLTAVYNNGTAGVNATLTNSSAQVALVLDGVSVNFFDIVLVKNQSTQAQNGIYVVTTPGSSTSNWVLTRNSNYNMPSQIVQNQIVLVNQGTVNAGIAYQETGSGPFTIGTTPIVFNTISLVTPTFPISMSDGGTGANLTPSNGGIFYSNATTGAILSGTATANQVLLSGSSSAPSWSTATYPITITANQLLYGSSSNVIGQLATANNGVLVTSNTGVPSYLANAASAGSFLTSSSGAPPVWSTATYPSTSGAVGTILRSNGTNIVNSTATFADTYTVNNILYASSGNAVSGLATANSSVLVTSAGGVPSLSTTLPSGLAATNLTLTTPALGTPSAGVLTNCTGLPVAGGGTGASTFTAYSVICAGTTATGNFQNVVGLGMAGQGLVSNGAGALPSWQNLSGSGTVNAGTTNELAYYPGNGTTVGGISTGNNGVLVTSNAGVPSINTSLGQGLVVSSSVLTVGAANNIPFNNGQGIQDSNGNAELLFSVTASAVNYVNITNAATTHAPIVAALGSDTNVTLQLKGQGTGGAAVLGTGTNDNATAGYVGEFSSSVVTTGSPVSLTTNTAANVTSISLTKGDWDVWGNVFLISTMGQTTAQGWISITSATQPDASLLSGLVISTSFGNWGTAVPSLRFSFASTTTVYLSALSIFNAGACSVSGGIYARRVR